MQKAASNTRKTITVSHSAIRHFLARLHSLVTAVAAGISVALTVLTAGAAATAIASKYGHFGVKLVNKRDFGDDQIDHGGGLETLHSRYADKLYRRLCPLLYAGGHA